MKKNYRILMTLGIIILIIPFLGIPNVFKTIMEFVIGILLIGVSLINKISYRALSGDSHEPIFEESNGEMNVASHIVEEEGFDDEGDYLVEDEELEEELRTEDDTDDFDEILVTTEESFDEEGE